jgi:hypothetical protein
MHNRVSSKHYYIKKQHIFDIFLLQGHLPNISFGHSWKRWSTNDVFRRWWSTNDVFRRWWITNILGEPSFSCIFPWLSLLAHQESNENSDRYGSVKISAHKENELPFLYSIKGALQTVFSMPQFMTIWAFELPTKKCLSFCFIGICCTWILATSSFKTTIDPIFPLMTNTLSYQVAHPLLKQFQLGVKKSSQQVAPFFLHKLSWTSPSRSNHQQFALCLHL